MRAAALVLSSVLMGLAGGAFAVMQLSFEPTGMVGMNWTIWALMMVVIGGFGTITGPIAGAIFVYYIVATELASYPTLGLFIEGALLIVIVRFAPRGIVPLVVDGIKAGVAARRRARPGQPEPGRPRWRRGRPPGRRAARSTRSSCGSWSSASAAWSPPTRSRSGSSQARRSG